MSYYASLADSSTKYNSVTCLTVFLLGPDIFALADHADLAALVTACDLELPDVSVVKKLGLLTEHIYLPFAVAVSAGWPNPPADAAQNAAYHAEMILFAPPKWAGFCVPD